MPKSYVDEIVIRYLMKEGYLISQGIWFQLPKEITRKKVSGWSDIDIFAVKPNEPPLVIQCKSFAGTEESKKFIENLSNWFKNAIEFLKNSVYKDWVLNRNCRQVFVVDCSVKKTEEKLKEKGIEIWKYEDILKKLLEKLKEEQKRSQKKGLIGKEEDVLLRIFSDMVRRNLIK
jgi:hypothetical protein